MAGSHSKTVIEPGSITQLSWLLGHFFHSAIVAAREDRRTKGRRKTHARQASAVSQAFCACVW